MDVRIYYEDTDAGGVVYYANFLRYFERARTEYLRERGVDVAAYARVGILFVVARAEIDYRIPAHYNDILDIGTSIADFSRTSLTFSHVIRLRGTDRVVVSGSAQLVCVNEIGKPRRLPEEILQLVAKLG